MKVLIVLVLAFFTACNAGGGYQGNHGHHHHGCHHPTQHQVDMVKDAFWDYVGKTTMSSKEYVWKVRQSPPGKSLCEIISKSIDVIYKFFNMLYTQVVIWTNEFYHRFCHEIDHLKREMEEFLEDFESDMQFQTKEMAAQLRCKIEDLKKYTAQYIESLDPTGLKECLMKKIHEIQEEMNKCFEHMHHEHHHHGHKGPPCHHGHQCPYRHHHDDNDSDEDSGEDDHHHCPHHHHHHEKDEDSHQCPHFRCYRHHQHHHDHKHPQDCNMKKKMDGCMGDFKEAIVVMVHNFDLQLAETTNDINKKMMPRGKMHGVQLVADSDSMNDQLTDMWNNWASYDY